VWRSSKVPVSNDDPKSALQTEMLQFFKLSKEIHENALRSVDVLNDLLNYDKIEMGNLKLEFIVVSIQDLVEKTAHEFKTPTAQKKINNDLEM
jgi:signal transduction histidine kinase